MDFARAREAFDGAHWRPARAADLTAGNDKQGNRHHSCRIRWSTAKDNGKIASGVAKAESWEVAMAKGQLRSNKEAKKPKAEKPKAGASAYKLSQGKSGQAVSAPAKKP